MESHVVGAVLCGGASRRMGRDKALIEVDGVPMARRVADVLRAGGCDRILAVGGDAEALAALGLEPIADRWPGEGPLGGLATALLAADDGDVLVLAPCDWLHPSPELVASLVWHLLDNVGDPDPELRTEAAYPWIDGRGGQWLPSAWLVGSEGANDVPGLLDRGQRRLDAVLDLLVSRVVDATPDQVADADTPADLP